MAESLQLKLQAALGADYRIDRELGGGGMSRVFLADETRLGRRIVIKVLTPELAGGVSVALRSASDSAYFVGVNTLSSTTSMEAFEAVQAAYTAGDGSAPRLQIHAQVVVVWWRLGMQCQRVSPKPAVRLDVHDLFVPARPTTADVTDDALPIVADLRPDSQWIGGMPTLDVTAGSWMYSPNERRDVNLPPTMVQGALTISEYREFFALLPEYGASYEQMLHSWRRLLSGAAADPRRWSLCPATSILCVAQVSTGARSSSEPCPS